MTTTETRTFGRTDNKWNDGDAASLSPLQALRYRSNLLGSDRAVANFGGGNTSSKVRERDHTGKEIDVLWVKGSGSDLATMKEKDFTGLRLDEVLPLIERDGMSDEEMVAYLARCRLDPFMPRSSVETLLHSFIPYPHVDHTHADATNMIACAENGEELARECFGDEAIWIPYIRPGFTLSKQVGTAVTQNPRARLALFAKHGLVTWGNSGEESYTRTIDAINRAADFVAERGGGRAPFGGQRRAPVSPEQQRDLFAAILPTLRGAVSKENPKILLTDTSDDIMEFVCGKDSSALSQVGAACPDHLIRTKMRPLWIDFDPNTESVEDLKHRILREMPNFRAWYEAYFARNKDKLGTPDEVIFDPYPRVVLIAGVGMVGIGQDHKAASLARDFYHRAIAVINGADTLDTYVSLTEEESFAVEYWSLELYKLAQEPKPKELAGRIALVTGGAGGIGSATVEALAAEGACVVVADLDATGAQEVAGELGDTGVAVRMDATAEQDVAAAFRAAILAFGGVDIVVSNAGLASSASVEETTVELWDRNHNVLAKGYFLVSREAFKLLKQQRMGGSIIFVASKNALAPGKNASAYSSAKAAELHLARCLAEEGGASGIRVNSVNPDAVLQGSKIWGSAWREERAQAYGIKPEELEEYYRQRNTLKVNILPDDIANAILFFASPRRSGKSTGNILNVDGGVPLSYPR
ncbi:MAG TPA: bifunctional aldolase/short-chain dehydrogenase [Chloroflexota bacterium]